MTAQIARQYADASKPDTPNGANVANFQLGLGNLWDCVQTLGVGVSSVVAGSATLTQANAGLVLVDASSGAVTLTLPAASAAVGAVFQFKRVDATGNAVTIQRAGSDTLDGATALTLVAQWDNAHLRSDGVSAWRLVSPRALVATSAGTAPAYTLTTVPRVPAAADVRVQVAWHASNSGAASTLALNGGSAVGIKQYDATGAKVDPTIVSGTRSDLVYDGTHWVILDPLPPAQTSVQVPRQQTVLSGPVDSNGAANFGGSTGSTTVTASGTLVATAANGFGTSGAVNRVGSITNPSWTGLSTNGTMYLYLDIAADGSCTPGSTTQQPAYQPGGSYSTTNGKFTFNWQEMVGKVGNGSTAAQAYRVFVGEVTVAAGVVSAITWYALLGRFFGVETSVAASSSSTVSHKLGMLPNNVTLWVAKTAGGTRYRATPGYAGASSYNGQNAGNINRLTADMWVNANAYVADGPDSLPITSPQYLTLQADRGW